MGQGQELWQRAKEVIAGGNMLLSKRPEMFLPEQWPAYFSRAKGCTVWDLDGTPYTDMSIMSVGTNTLGYGRNEVDDAVRKVVDMGNMSTLNAPEEVELAERLVAMHPWADKVRFARTGGEANAVAIRIARAASGRDDVAICGYHGWHDWYLASNLASDSALDGHLLPGLGTAGVPRGLTGSVHPFAYGDIAALERIVAGHSVGVIKMEVGRSAAPDVAFLTAVRAIADAKGIVLVFDECTSGFRQSFGGLHKLTGVAPDMAVFGKALGNGYAVTAVLGKRAVMEAGEASFISSTFWTERIGSAAGLATLEVMEREKSWERITRTGQDIAAAWQAMAARHGLQITISGLPALIGFSLGGARAQTYKTLITQEMLKRGYLAGMGVYVCTEHSEEVVARYLETLEPVFALIGSCEAEGRDPATLLDGPVAQSGFARLT